MASWGEFCPTLEDTVFNILGKVDFGIYDSLLRRKKKLLLVYRIGMLRLTCAGRGG